MQYVFGILFLVQFFTLANAEDKSESKSETGYFFAVQGGADASITGTLCSITGSTDFGLIVSWKPEHTKTKKTLQTGLMLSCSYNFFDGWLVTGGLETGLAEIGYIITGAAWYFTTQQFYIQTALMIPFTETEYQSSSMHSYMIVSCFLPLSWLVHPDTGIPGDTLFKKLYIGLRIRLLFCKNPQLRF
ncbi:MAG TPA: hypothetical protein P5519_04085 [Spirochaetia bacterium]|nr:hypothetical protein [Spirochaetales bacterium]HQK33643.1 hypothetical protein [Spirochaetales bacterium]HRS65050.1 hypothetical protein [Spirochaetia bacterium]HRV27731.1 hypothetical protein [Spirochaetia bacterium]